MSRKKNSVPTYRLHKQSGQAIVTLRDADFRRRDVLLGLHDSPESHAEYRRVLAEQQASPEVAAIAPFRTDATVNEIVLAFMRWAETYYRDADGVPTGESAVIARSLMHVKELYGHTLATEFGPRSLAVVRQKMIDAKWCRSVINKRIDRVKRMFKWATAEELVPVTVYQSLRTLAGLRRGRSAAKESEPVQPVDPAHVVATLPHLNRHTRTMAELQLLTGMRPGEVCRLTLDKIDTAGVVWIYQPKKHKTEHHGRKRPIPFGPRAKAVLESFLVGRKIKPTEPVFSPRLARDERYAEMRAKRKSKVPPSQACRKVANPIKKPRETFAVSVYANAIAFAAESAGVPHWHPNQIRHTFASEIRRLYGLEAAQVLLGHARADVTQVYAERDAALAIKVALEVG